MSKAEAVRVSMVLVAPVELMVRLSSPSTDRTPSVASNVTPVAADALPKITVRASAVVSALRVKVTSSGATPEMPNVTTFAERR
jgi:hypothetical protein